MRLLNNDKGIALVTSLMFTMLALVISMALLYMAMYGARTSGALKRYKTVLDAAYGGTEIITKDLLNSALAIVPDATTAQFSADFLSSMDQLSNKSFSSCLQKRINLQRRFWPAACTNIGDTSQNPDISFRLNATSGSAYNVYAQIIDTREWRFTSISTSSASGSPVAISQNIAGNSDRSGTNNLQKGGTGNQLYTTTTHYPYMYNIEIVGKRQQNDNEKAKISVLYAY